MESKGVIVADVQADFTTWKHGALAVPGTDRAFIDQVRRATAAYKRQGHAVFAVQDWHPPDHVSFFTNHPGRKPFELIAIGNRSQVLWPPHCIQGTAGAALLLAEPLFEAVVQKGTDRRFDSYSGFKDDGGAATELDGLLQRRGLRELIIYGLATDYCVKATALDAAAAGYRVAVVASLCRGITPATTAAALETMRAAGIGIAAPMP
ncbi:MAG: isochorismatase family protein [Desulfobacterales bacterium]|jgi:nicotinamidase/pyrazinamidase|nr:isochorismatase family protein [Desulfobacterales bacterium]